MFTVPCRSRRAERLVLGVLLVGLFGLYAWAAHYRLDPLDEGYFAYTSSRVMVGDLPYRDFSTPYTPAFFYLNALLFRVFGLDLVTLRLSLVVARLSLLLVLYLLGRRLVPPAFAALPVFMQLAEDQAPSVWESHPAWWATLAALVGVWCVCSYRESGAARWWLAASVTAAVSFAFKQNLGLFALAALGILALAEPDSLPDLDGPGWLERLAARLPPDAARRVLQRAGPLSLLLLAGGVAYELRAALDLAVLSMFALPFAALALDRLLAPRPERSGPSIPDANRTLVATLARLGLLVAGFAAVTLPWLVGLLMLLGPGQTPFMAFLGAIDAGGYYLALEPLRPELVPVLALALLAPALAWVVLRPWPGLLRIGLLLAMFSLVVGFLWALLRYLPDVHPRALRGAALLSIKATTNLGLYLPSVAFWGGYGLLMRGRADPATAFNLRWYLLAGSLLLLNQYPRMDETHLLFSAHLLWIVGAYGLWRLFSALTARLPSGWSGRLGRASLFLALLGLPLVSVWPTLELRREDLLVRQSGARFQLTTPTYVPLGMPRASVAEVEEFGLKYQRIVAYFQQHTEPGQRIFVYPAAPLLYYLVDRPNATRFNHVFPGLLSADDEEETIDRLARVPAAYVIWDSFGAEYWGKPGVYQKLTDYIWNSYEPAESIGGYEIMRRKPS